MNLSPHLRLHNDALSSQAKAQVVPIDKPQRRKTGPKGLARTQMERKPSRLKRSVMACTPAQKAAVESKACLVCSHGPCDPAHLVPRSLAPGAGEDPRATVPLCRRCHDLYERHQLDLSPYLEPHYRESVAWAVEAVGLFGALREITGKYWQPIYSEESTK